MKAIKINKFIFSIVFKRLFNKGNRKTFFLCSYIVYRNTCESLGETRNCVETLSLRARVPTQFLHAHVPTQFLYNSIETRKMFSIS
jgi:hypothetical protein